MAGQWIEWEKGLDRKPECFQIGRILGIPPLHAAGCCMKVWEWTEEITVDGIIEGIKPEDVSSAVGIPGIGEALYRVGWINLTSSGISIPNWTRHNGWPAKRRAQNAQRMRESRSQLRDLRLRGGQGN